uniref:exosome complex component RRP4-like n=1 Tax=Styela clava TaxID=7725 RepID=UPI0019399FA8|nr:exosome complex component RRP4-like [Styela clava]
MESEILIRRPAAYSKLPTKKGSHGLAHFVTPGDIVTDDTDYMRGHGSYMRDEKLHACVAGVVERINKLISVKPLKLRYNGEVGDIVVGRIKEVQQKRWKVNTNSRVDSVLHLSFVNLPGGELRRRSAADQLTMREYLKEGDLISAEVQQVHNDGSLSLHTRSLRYGKLGQGCLVVVSPSLVKRRKNHIHNLPCGATVVLANNGFIWIYATPATDNEEMDKGHGGFVADVEPVALEDREVICRLRNCIKCLAQHNIQLYDTSIMYTYDVSLSHQIKELLNPDIMSDVVNQAVLRLRREES